MSTSVFYIYKFQYMGKIQLLQNNYTTETGRKQKQVKLMVNLVNHRKHIHSKEHC